MLPHSCEYAKMAALNVPIRWHVLILNIHSLKLHFGYNLNNLELEIFTQRTLNKYIYSLLDGVVLLTAFDVWICNGIFSPRGARMSLAGVTRTKAYSHLFTPRILAASSAEESSLLMVLSGIPSNLPIRSLFSASFSASEEYLRDVMSSLSFFS